MQNNYCGITAGILSPSPRQCRERGPHPHDVTVNFVPITAELPRLPRYYRLPRYRVPLQFQRRRQQISTESVLLGDAGNRRSNSPTGQPPPTRRGIFLKTGSNPYSCPSVPFTEHADTPLCRCAV